jgi:hypothetical protein
MSDVPGILFSSLGGDVTSYRQLLSHPKVVASLHNYGIAVVRGAQKYVHPCISSLASTSGTMLEFLDQLSPSLKSKRFHMNTFRYHRAGAGCMVQDRGCASETQPETIRSCYSRVGGSLSLDAWDWDKLVKKVLPDTVLLYASDTPLSLLAYEVELQKRSSSSSSSGGGGGGGAASADTGKFSGLCMTKISASDCIYRALMVGDGFSSPGMSTVYTYWGRAGSVFAAHTEDHNLPSINQLVYGAPKVW